MMATQAPVHPPHQQPSPSQTLPSISSLTNGLPNPSNHSPSSRGHANPSTRDSGTWNPQSKHSSMNNPSLHVSTLLNPDESQPRNSIPSTPTSVRTSQQQPSSGILPSINQGFEQAPQNRQNADYYGSTDSRRSSIDSRMHAGFNNLGLNNPASPYESQNTSQVSLAASLRRPNGQVPMSPLSSRNSIRSHTQRVAPPIVSNRISGAPDPMAARPTQGFPWAFPDSTIPEEHRRTSSSDESSVHRDSISRQNSFAASSIRSSVFSLDQNLPTGQRRFDDEPGTTHHHSLQHRSIASLQSEGGPGGIGGNYSRTPELRISHKLAERKRRSEMKDLFEELNKAVPTNGGAKASKWEILSKAIEYIRGAQAQDHQMRQEVQRLRSEAEYARESQKEREMLHTEISVMHERLRTLDPRGPHIYGQYTSRLAQQQTQQAANGQPSSSYALPPMNAAHPSATQHQQAQHYPHMPAPTGAMQGVEYGINQRQGYDMR